MGFQINTQRKKKGYKRENVHRIRHMKDGTHGN